MLGAQVGTDLGDGAMGDERSLALVEHKVQVASRSPLAYVTGLWSISNPKSTLAFQKRCEGMTQIDAWIDPAQLEGGLQEICDDGFQIRRSGLTLAVSLHSPAPREVVFCTVGVGNALCVEENELSEAPPLAHGYDSHLLLGPAEHQSAPAVYRYQIYDAAQVMPRFFVRWDLQRRRVGGVGAIEAEEKEVLEMEKMMAAMKPHSIAADAIGSAITKARTKISQVQSSYDAVLAASSQVDSLSARHRAKLENTVSTLASSAERVNQNATEMEEQLFSAVQTALGQLQQITQGKLQQLLSCEMEVRRQLQEMDIAEALLQEQREVMDPTQFVESWSRHQAHRERLRSHPVPTVEDSVDTDISIQGSIEPVCVPVSRTVYGAASTHATTLAVPTVAAVQGNFNLQHHALNASAASLAATHHSSSAFDAPPSLKQLAETQRRAILEMGIHPKSKTPFSTSAILSSSLASIIFYAISFCDEPDTELLYSTERDGFSMERFHAHCDGIGPSLLVARVGDHIFGGFAATSWNRNATRFGTPKSFLFSLAPHDLKVVYTPLGTKTCCLWASPEAVTWGIHDLCFKDDFKTCVSELENSYSAGLPPGDPLITTMLAGAHVTAPEQVEVWGFAH